MISPNTQKGEPMWKVEVVYDGGRVETIKVKNKIQAAMTRDSYLHHPDVVDVYVFDGDDYIDPVEL